MFKEKQQENLKHTKVVSRNGKIIKRTPLKQACNFVLFAMWKNPNESKKNSFVKTSTSKSENLTMIFKNKKIPIVILVSSRDSFHICIYIPQCVLRKQKNKSITM